MLGGKTGQGYPYILVGSASSAPLSHPVFSHLQESFKEITIPNDISPKELDILLANTLSGYSHDCEIAGCTIKVAGIEASTGGVLGDPREKGKSAFGQVEMLECGWGLLTYPGGPGIAFKTAHKKEHALQHKWRYKRHEGLKGRDLLAAYSKNAFKKGIESLIAITDGTGSDSSGAALIQSGRDYIVWSLDQV
jgi:hypothetical protein